ncbi:hypothetical protein HELRODRAFT_177298 [Helobdella robusta]|uniref:Cilia- and flagella-associated protein 52 n=1 Tax=Helobdella robusta TaxID=6412 RepID=T1FBH0_HELRO|nr:hypothetical protein HELRODRAFT_177298 [Helobdella robusta]ESN98064.1 hypothetical protein HELRODRAFT_177298 [Helobdella robusta]
MEIEKVIGFDGTIVRGLKCHPDGYHIVYAVGNMVVIEHTETRCQSFLQYNKDDCEYHKIRISCLDLSKSGIYIAVGTVNKSISQSDILIWCFADRTLYAKYSAHRIEVATLMFSCCDKYLYSIGGADDRLLICSSDELGYAGTSSGDIVIFNMNTCAHLTTVLRKTPFCCGLTQLSLNQATKEFIVGGGDGTLAREKMLEGKITSIVSRSGSTYEYFIGTDAGNVYKINFITAFKCSLAKTSHMSVVNDFCQPYGNSDLLVSGSHEQVRVWSMRECKELVRMTVPNHTCLVVHVLKDGSWSDSRIRAYYPESGQPMFLINNSYGSKVTALTATSSATGSSSSSKGGVSSSICKRVISGSNLGHVVIWNVPAICANMEFVYITDHVLLKQHRAPVTAVKIRTRNVLLEGRECCEEIDEIVSCSLDGTLILWDLSKKLPKTSIKTNHTMFKDLVFHPVCQQFVVATGSGGRLSYFDVVTTGSLMFQTDDCGVKCDINCLDVDCLGEFLVTGDDNKMVKIWRYGDGEMVFKGCGHSTPVSRVRFTPDRKNIISSGTDGSIFAWIFDPSILYPECQQKEGNKEVCGGDDGSRQLQQLQLQPAGGKLGQGDACHL